MWPDAEAFIQCVSTSEKAAVIIIMTGINEDPT